MRARRVAKWLVFFILVGALCGLAWWKLRKDPLAVEVFRAARGEVRSTVTSPTSGTLVSEREATVAAEWNGRVAELLLRPGDRAAEGAPVVVLDEADAKVEVRAAEAALATRQAAFEATELRFQKAEQDLAAAESLARQKLIADELFRATKTVRDTARVDVEAARRAVREAEVAVERAQVALAKRRVRAPFAGLIRRKRIEAGEYVNVGMAVFEIYDDSRVFVRAPIDEVDAPRIRAGLPVEIAIEAFGDRIFSGVVRDIEPGVRLEKELNRTVEVEVELRDPPQPKQDGSYPPGEGPIRVGMSADIEIVTETRRDVLRVPAYAVHVDADLQSFVYLFADGVIAKRPVKVGLTNWDFAEIERGLEDGDPVIVSLDLEGLEEGGRAAIRREVRRVQAEQ